MRAAGNSSAWDAGTMDDASWGALALALSALAAIWTWHAFRRRRLASGVRGVGLTLLPIAAYLTHTLRMLGRIADVIGDWAAGFVFSPTVWLGLVLAGVAVVLILVSVRLPGGTRGTPAVEDKRRTTPSGTGARDTRQRETALGEIGLGDDFADIEAILRKRGIR